MMVPRHGSPYDSFHSRLGSSPFQTTNHGTDLWTTVTNARQHRPTAASACTVGVTYTHIIHKIEHNI